MKKSTLLVFALIAFTASMPLVYSVMAIEPPETSQTVELKFWYTENPSEEAILNEKIALFEAANPNITITATVQDFFGVGAAYRTAYIASEESDVLRTPRDDVISFAEDELIHNVTDAIVNVTDFLDASISVMTYEGEIWGIPQLVDSPVMMYNKEMFNDAGVPLTTVNDDAWNWTAFNTYIADVNGTVVTGSPATGAYALSLAGPFFSIQPYFYGKSAVFFDNQNYTIDNIAINNTASRTALQELFDLINGSYTPIWSQQGWANFVGDFGNGKVAMIATGPWEVNNLITNMPQFNGTDYPSSNLGFMQLPNDGASKGALIGGQYYTMSSHLEVGSDKYDAAVKFMQFLTSPETMSLGAINSTHAPARKSVMAFSNVTGAANFEYVEAFYEQAANAFELVPNPNYGALESAFGNNIDSFLKGEVDLDTLITDTTLQWIDILTPPTPPPRIPGFAIPTLVGALLIGVTFVAMSIICNKKRN
jgi:ABC-type glycerol-3-phosphate transport system substrate-binding protein